MASPPFTDPRRIVIVGGGIAALEAVLALRALAPTNVQITLVAPEVEFASVGEDVGRPFAPGPGRPVDLDRFMRENRGGFRRTVGLSVDTEAHSLHCATGADEGYDSLIVAVGASARPAFQDAVTFGADSLALDGFLAHLAQGFFRSVAFIVPRGSSWPLPLYELALLTADEIRGTDMHDVDLHLITPEAAPLAMLGTRASAAIADVLRAGHITVHAGTTARVRRGHVDMGSAGALVVDRVVALPALTGPRLEGLPSNSQGFIPVDDHGRVHGVCDVYAAGDATDGQTKQGGLALRQADTVAEHVAQAAGARVLAAADAPLLQGRLLTGHQARLQEGGKTAAAVAAGPLWWPPVMASGRYLAPYLETLGLVAPPVQDDMGGEGIDVELSTR